MTASARFARIRRNPSLLPGVAETLGPGFPWHTHAASPRSSQALCVSAWAPLAGLEVRHEVVERFLAEWLPEWPGSMSRRRGARGTPAEEEPAQAAAGVRRWRVALEVSDPAVLGERGGHPSAVDVVLEARDAVVCVESKFLRDALTGFRGCGQFPEACRGFYGPGSDLAGGTGATCRLGVRDGRREARRYWEVAAGLFRPEALTPGPGESGGCPLHRQYQLARTLLYAKALAERPAMGSGAEAGGAAGRRHYAALVVAPAATCELLERQTEAFAAGVLLPAHAGRVAVARYEGLVRLLCSCGDPHAVAVGDFVAGLLPPAQRALVAARAVTARELRRRAEADRRARRRTTPPDDAHAEPPDDAHAESPEDDGSLPRTMTS